MAPSRISSSRPCKCLRCRQGEWQSRRLPCSHQRTVVRVQREESFQSELDEVRRELAVLIEDSNLSDITKKHSECWNVIEFHNRKAFQILKYVKAHEEAMNDLQESYQQNQDDVPLMSSTNQELEERVATINGSISHAQTNFPEAKKAALQGCQRVVEEKYQCEIDRIQNRHATTKLAFDNLRTLQAEITYATPERFRQLETKHMERVEMMFKEEREVMMNNKKEWMSFKRCDLQKEEAEFKSILRQNIESELKESFRREVDLRVTEARLACLQEQKLTRQAKIEKILADAKKQWQEEQE